MASKSESGHVINVSNFKLLIDKCGVLGGAYQPSNPDLTIVNLTARWVVADAAQGTINAALQQSKEPINERQLLFKPLSKLVTRIVNVVKSTKASAELKRDVKGIGDKIRGVRKAKKVVDGEAEEQTVSTSHMSFVMRAENFLSLINLLKGVGEYAPNEVELKIASLEVLYNNMKQRNDAIGTIIAPVENARMVRDEALYKEETGIVDVAQRVKNYVKGAFEAGSSEYKLVSGIKFTRKR